jgi:hypothetical protein
MKRLAGLIFLVLTGCSTAPLADFMDFTFRPKPIPPTTPAHGGVNGPQPAPPPGAMLVPPVPAGAAVP